MGKQKKENTEARKEPVKYRISFINAANHQLLWNTTMTKWGLITIAVTGIFIILAGIYSLIAFTPVRRTIPGYPDAVTKRTAVRNALKIDSLEREIRIWELYARNISTLINGGKPDNIDSIINVRKTAPVVTAGVDYSQDNASLKEEVLKKERFSVSDTGKEIRQIEGLVFFPPAKGIITQGFDPSVGHPFIDIATSENAVVAAVLDGTVINAGWSDDTGFTLHIQHANDLISIYKHNEKLLKSVGDKVKAGTSVALAGNTGKLSTAPHLHFELWYKGEAIDPTKYINF